MRIISIIFLMISISGWAADGSQLNGLYGDYTPRTCGIHVEGFPNEVITVATNNPFVSGHCGSPGHINVYDCTSSDDWCYANPGTKCPGTKIRPLPDGNFLLYNPCSNITYKLIRY